MEVSINDMRTFFGNSISKVKGNLAYVGDISEGHNPDEYRVRVMNSKSKRLEDQVLAFGDFQNVTERLGFVNGEKSVAYWSRRTFRQFGIGLSRGNTVLAFLGRRDEALEEFYNPALLNTLKGDYPSFQQALKAIEEGARSVAFDRQFAIMDDMSVYYRTQNVGMVKAKAKSVKDIVFDRNYKYLETLLGGDYEKNLRNFIEKAKKG